MKTWIAFNASFMIPHFCKQIRVLFKCQKVPYEREKVPVVPYFLTYRDCPGRN